MIISRDIEAVDHISREDFMRNYFIPQKPVVIRGLLKNQEAGEKWNPEYFKSCMGDLEVDVYDNGLKKDKSAYTKADLKMKFGDFLNVIEKDEHTDLRMFLFNLFKHNHNLKKEFPCPEIFRGALDGLGFTFFAGKDTTVRLHFDIDMSNVLHTQVWGQKRVQLFSPANNELLYKLPFNTYSLANIENPDYDKYPALRYVRGQECILEPGDSVFMPSGYWHLMTYLNGGMSVAYRKMAPGVKMKLQGLSNLGVYLPFDKLMGALMNESWVNTKGRIATARANRDLAKLQAQQLPG